MKKLWTALLVTALVIGCLGIAPVSALEQGSIRLALQTNTNITDYSDNYLTKLWEDTGDFKFDFDFLPASAGDTRNKIALMVSGGAQLPDVIVTGAMSDDEILEYGSKGIFLPLDEWLNDANMAVYFSQIPEEDRKQMLEDVRSADGHIYGLPRYVPSAWASTNKRVWINDGWLKNLNLEMPTTTDELYAVLEAFVNNDPNGNGIQDEIGVYGMSSNETILSMMNYFIYTSGLSDLALSDDGNSVIAPFAQDAYRQGLEWMSKLYQDGLLDDNMFTDDRTTMIATMNGPENVVGVIAFGSFPTLWPNSAYGQNENVKEYDMLPPMVGPGGVAYAPHVDQRALPRWFITKDAANPELAFKAGDLAYSIDIGLAARYGNLDNIITDLDELKAAGYTNSYKEMGIVDHIKLRINGNINATSNNEYWADIGPRYASALWDLSYSAIVENDDTTSNVSTFHGKNYLYNVPAKPDHLLPILKYTAEELDEINDLRTSIESHVKNSVAQFILGARSLENEWNTYLKELETIGLSTYLRVAQGAFERTK